MPNNLFRIVADERTCRCGELMHYVAPPLVVAQEEHTHVHHHEREGTAEDWGHIAREHGKHQAAAAPRQIMESLRWLDEIEVGFAATQLTHCLMAGTLARRSGASDEEVVAALCHDIGKLFSIPNHGPIAAEMLKPYVSDDIYHAVYWHQDFQGRYYFEHLGKDKDARKRFEGEPWYAFAEKLVDDWDAPAFDPDFPVDPLESFEPEVTRVFSNPKKMV